MSTALELTAPPTPGGAAKLAPVVALIARHRSFVPGTPPAVQLRRLLTRRGATRRGAEAAVRLVKEWDTTPLTHVSPARRRVVEWEMNARAAYLVNAARRVSRGIQDRESRGLPPSQAVAEAASAERAYYRLHVAAADARRTAAIRAEAEAAKSKKTPVKGTTPGQVGWYAVRDAKVTPACRSAHGTNFTVSDPPAIGIPGALHAGRCRCVSGPPWPYGKPTSAATAHLAPPPLSPETKLSRLGAGEPG